MGRYFLTGIGTGVGKTFVAAILTEALKADYWKPLQCGTEDGTDKERVRALLTNTNSVLHDEAYCLQTPASPHLAAEREMVKITMESFVLPQTKNHLIIEGAGGILVPLNESNFIIDLARDFETEVILVCSSYLGCINHSLLSIDYLLSNDIPIKGLVLNGNFEPEVRRAIINYAEVPILTEIPTISDVSREAVHHLSKSVNTELF